MVRRGLGNLSVRVRNRDVNTIECLCKLAIRITLEANENVISEYFDTFTLTRIEPIGMKICTIIYKEYVGIC